MRAIRYLMVVLLAVPAWAQSGAQLDMNLHGLEGKADEVVSVNLEGESLNEGRKLLAIRNTVSKPIKELVDGLKGIYVRRFWFGSKKAYDDEDVEPIHQQLQKPGWSPMIAVKVREKDEAVSVYSYTENEALAGVTVLSSDPQEVTVINIVGAVDLEALAELGRQMGIPAMKLATTELPPKKALPAPKK